MNPDAVVVGVRPPTLAHLAADASGQLRPIAWPLIHTSALHLARSTRTRTRVGRRHTGRPRPATSGRPSHSRDAASGPLARRDSALACGLHPGLACVLAVVPWLGRSGVLVSR